MFWLIFSFGLLTACPVFAIDGNYATPYATDPESGQPVQDNQQGGGTGGFVYGGRDTGLPFITIAGGGLLVLCVLAVAIWKYRGHKQGGSS